MESAGLPPEEYVPPVLGNGDILMMLDETGLQSFNLPELYQRRIGPPPRIWMPGRRYDNSMYPVIPFGHLEGEVLVDGRRLDRAERTGWSQELDVETGTVVTVEEYGSLRITTTSFVLHNRNLAVFSRKVEGGSATFTFRHRWHNYVHPDQFPRRMQVDWAVTDAVRAHYTADGVREYQGILHLFSDSRTAAASQAGNTSELVINAADGDRATVFLSLCDDADGDYQDRAADNLRWAREGGFQAVYEDHCSTWQSLRGASRVSLPESARRVQEVWETCRYTLLGASTRWSVPPGYSNIQWEGRYFHDELFAHYALLTGGYEHARKIVNYRRATLDLARARTGGRGARYAWESIEDGREGLPMCATIFYEIWHMASIAICAWQDYRFSPNGERLKETCYPVIRECAEFFRLWVLVEDSSGEVTTVPCVDLDEEEVPVRGALGTQAGAVATLEIAAQAARVLDVDGELVQEWERLAAAARKNLPVQDGCYVPFVGARHQVLAAVMPLFPLGIATGEDLIARSSVLSYFDRCRTKYNWGPRSDVTSSWTWNTAWMVSALARMGDGERAGEAILRATASANTFGGVNEAMGKDGRSPSVWFNTTAGAFMAAVNDMLLGSWDNTLRIFPALPPDWKDVSFRLAASGACMVEAALAGGKVRTVCISTLSPHERAVALPLRLVEGEPSVAGGGLLSSEERDGLLVLTLRLGGDTLITFGSQR